MMYSVQEVEDNKEKLYNEVHRIIENKLGVSIKDSDISYATRVGKEKSKDSIGLLNSLLYAKKREIRQAKVQLKGTKHFIGNDVSKEERIVRSKSLKAMIALKRGRNRGKTKTKQNNNRKKSIKCRG